MLPESRRVVDGKRRQSMRSLSVSGATYDRIAAAAAKHGCSKADIVRAACAGILAVEPAPAP